MTDASSTSPAPASAAGGDTRPVSSNSEQETETSVGPTVASDAKDADNLEKKPENKQKRKRTSPEDQLVLEAFYKENPKPNKAARKEILKDVKGMNEKEVQIWFQNRRQINRRKQRPLLPHEIAAFGLGGMAALSSDPAAGFSSSQSVEQPSMSSQQEETSSSQESAETLREPNISPTPKPPEGNDVLAEAKVEELGAKSSLQMSARAALETQVLSQSNDSSSTVSQSFISTPGYLANRWNAVNSPWSTPASSQQLPFETPNISLPSLPLSCPERIGGSRSLTPPSSQVRLSMSLDGKAEIVTSDSSPPRFHAPRPSSSGSSLPQRRLGLQRSHSALPFASSSRRSLHDGRLAPRLIPGRSRDARTWEFCCDGEIRDELTTQAENESTGSAVAAISLLRSASNSALKNNNSKRNTPVKQSSTHAQGKKPKMGRAMSSLARLQSTGTEEPSDKGKDKDKDGLMRSPSGDSDKENRSPTETGAYPRRRPLPSGRGKKPSTKRVLGDNHNVPTHAVNFGGANNRNKRRKSAHQESEIFEDDDNGEVGQEVEKFMRGEISPSKKGDLDCVQGLLSLSQGNWR